MKEWFIASSLAMAGGGAFYAGAFDSADIVQTVNKPPSMVYDGFAVILNDYSSDFYQLTYLSADPKAKNLDQVKFDVKSEEDKFIDYTMKVKDQPVIRVKVEFEPLADGTKTKVEADVDVDLAALPPAEGDDPMSALAANPLAFEIAIRSMMIHLIKGIEDGSIAEWGELLTMFRGELMSSPEFGNMRMAAERARRDRAMADASAPMVDPSEAAVNPVGVSAAPSVNVSR